MRRAGLILAVLAALALLACGEDDQPRSSDFAKAEPIDRLPELPADWQPHINRDAGLAFGVPPQWRVEDAAQQSELRSPLGFAAITIIADRSNEALEIPLREQVSAAATVGHPDLRSIRPGEPERYRHHYAAYSIEARGQRTSDGAPLDLLYIELGKEGFANFFVLVAENPDLRIPGLDEQTRQIIASIRGLPVGVGLHTPGAG